MIKRSISENKSNLVTFIFAVIKYAVSFHTSYLFLFTVDWLYPKVLQSSLYKVAQALSSFGYKAHPQLAALLILAGALSLIDESDLFYMLGLILIFLCINIAMKPGLSTIYIALNTFLAVRENTTAIWVLGVGAGIILSMFSLSNRNSRK